MNTESIAWFQPEGLHCPVCASKDITACRVTSPSLKFEDSDEGDVEIIYWELLDCRCENCDAEWLFVVMGDE